MMDDENFFGDTVQGYSIPRRREQMVAGDEYERHVLVCTDNLCRERGGFEVKKKLFKSTFDRNLDEVKVSAVRSLGYCDRGPIVVVYPDDVWYEGVTLEDVPRIIDGHFVDDEPVSELTFDPELPDDYKLLVVCTFLSQCGPEGGGKALGEFKRRARGVNNVLVVQSYGCLKECSMGPVACEYPDGDWYPGLEEWKLDEIWESEVMEGRDSKFKAGGIHKQD